MSIADVAARLAAMQDVIDSARRSLNAAATKIDEAKDVLADTLFGSSLFEVAELLRRYDDIQRDTEDLSGALDVAETATRHLRARLVRESTPSGTPTSSAGARGQRPRNPAPSPTGPTPVMSELIERLRDELPPPVVRGTGQKTHGRWIDPDGVVREEVSGEDQKSREALQFFQDELGFTRPPIIVSHVEIKLAYYMRANAIGSASLVVNNRPCRGSMGCDRLLPLVLPQGYTMTVYGPDGFKQQYKGGGGQ